MFGLSSLTWRHLSRLAFVLVVFLVPAVEWRRSGHLAGLAVIFAETVLVAGVAFSTWAFRYGQRKAWDARRRWRNSRFSKV